MRITLFFLLCMILVKSGSSQGVSDCPALSSLQIDGAEGDWSMQWVKDEEGIFSYNVCADDNNLYVRVRTDVGYVKRKMAAFGFTVWMDPSGKKKKKLGLKFPAGGPEAVERAAPLQQAASGNLSSSQKAEMQKLIDEALIKDIEVLELIGLADNPITSTRSGITNGIKLAIALDSESGYVYEAVIPFKSFRLSKASLDVMGIGFETGKYVPEKAKTNVKGAEVQGFTGANAMARTQGYESLVGNPKLSYASSAWTTIKLK